MCVLLHQCPMDHGSYSRTVVVMQQSAIWQTCALRDSLGPQFLPHPVLFNSYCLNGGKPRQLISRHGCPSAGAVVSHLVLFVTSKLLEALNHQATFHMFLRTMEMGA